MVWTFKNNTELFDKEIGSEVLCNLKFKKRGFECVVSHIQRKTVLCFNTQNGSCFLADTCF